MMRQGRFYRHNNFMDVMVYVRKVYDVHKDYVRVKFEWWNKTLDHPIGIVQNFKIPKKDLVNWEVTNRSWREGCDD
jgi:hypothetical protein